MKIKLKNVDELRAVQQFVSMMATKSVMNVQPHLLYDDANVMAERLVAIVLMEYAAKLTAKLVMPSPKPSISLDARTGTALLAAWYGIDHVSINSITPLTYAIITDLMEQLERAYSGAINIQA